ncbi:MAG TPA: PAS domain-containing sensor histidine kinase [Longimicrobium sp.]|uniref:sensor histidine kinase n=1 Tax=Longimicrobium sp. TaxID=2029185 RepID=UPI002EDAD49F
MSPVSTLEIARHAGLEALADGFCLADAESRVTYWNAAAERLFGIARAEALEQSLWSLLPGDTGAVLRERMVRSERGAAVVPLTLLADGELFSRHLAVHATRLDDGGTAVHFRDSTAERRIADQHAQLLESIRDGFIATDAEWRITYVNRAAEVLVSLRRDRAVGTVLWTLLPPDPPELAAAIRGTMVDREPRHLSAIHLELLFGRRFDAWTHALPDGGVSILFEDVTERLTKEMELARLAAEAEEASRAKSRFFAAVSHELRTPLNAIVGYTHLLATATYGEVPAGAVRASERASVCAEHLARLIDDVLLLTTLEIERLPVFPAAVEMEPFLGNVLPHLRQQAEAKGLAFSVDLPEEFPAVFADPERLRQIVTPVVSNAIKFTSRGSVGVQVRAAGQPGWMEIVVRDTGPGIAPEDRDRIFDPFEQLGDEARSDSANRGTGLGLTLARRLARHLGGDLGTGEPQGEGAEFIIRLPLAAQPATQLIADE